MSALTIAVREIIAARAAGDLPPDFDSFLAALADRGFGHVTFSDLKAAMREAEVQLVAELTR
jgi:hypothetical protein